jgi:hypothetical protein
MRYTLFGKYLPAIRSSSCLKSIDIIMFPFEGINALLRETEFREVDSSNEVG